ncbi:MAG TPA: 50S ribosomal protein L20 [Planctomycetaceae bacterium]|nr:50S ribosomal protein L20 [Planctomycetaceae bacterium]
MRTRKGAARAQAKRRLLKRAKGYVSGRRKLLRSRKETLLRAGAFAFRDRRAKRREFRKLWIIRLSAACQQHGLRYSQFINGLTKANISLDRKQLSEMAINDPTGFTTVVDQVKAALAA